MTDAVDQYGPTPTKEELIARYGEPDGFAMDSTAPSNDQKADWGRAAVEQYGETVNGSAEYDDADGMASDLVADVMHFLTKIGLDPDAIVDKARRHFVAEAGRGYGDAA